jgi:hypothetical protein
MAKKTKVKGKKPKPLRYRQIIVCPWAWDGFVIEGGTTESVNKLMKEMTNGADVQFDTAAGNGFAFTQPGKPWLIWVETLDDVAVLAHEALHATFAILRRAGMEFSHDSEEAYTYTMTDILDRALYKKGWVTVK